MKSYCWQNYTNEQLLSLKINQLELKFNDHIKTAINIVLKELSDHNINIPLKFVLSDDWFCPDCTINIHIPFFLCNQRLMELEANKMGYAEGTNFDYLLKLLRHEIGHAIDNYLELRRKKHYRLMFGKVSIPYRLGDYNYDSKSTDFVVNLDEGYAQKHPVEDFAETFAVWLSRPKSCWKSKYNNTEALAKLNYVDIMMNKIDKLSIAKLRDYSFPIENIDRTLKKYYQYKRDSKGIDIKQLPNKSS